MFNGSATGLLALLNSHFAGLYTERRAIIALRGITGEATAHAYRATK